MELQFSWQSGLNLEYRTSIARNIEVD